MGGVGMYVGVAWVVGGADTCDTWTGTGGVGGAVFLTVVGYRPP